MAQKELVVDCHVHVTSDGKWFDTDIEASLERLLGELNDSPIKKVVLLPAGREEEDLKNATKFIISLIKRYPNQMMGFSTYYSGLTVAQIIENKLIGVKIHPRQNKIDVLNKKLYPFYEAVSQEELPILFDSYCVPVSDMPLEMIRPLVYRELAAMFPSLKIILAHCGMPFIWEAYTILKWYKNVYADLSHLLTYFKGTSLIDDLAWVVRKIPGKFIYGSDFPEMGIHAYFKEFEKFCDSYNLSSDEILKNFYKLNANVA